MLEYLLLKVRINYTQYFTKNHSNSYHQVKDKFIHNIKSRIKIYEIYENVRKFITRETKSVEKKVF